MLSNYGIKRMIPRLIVAAILVNVSFWIAALAVDVSNLLGASIYNIMDVQLGAIVSDGSGNNLGGWEEFTAWLLAGGVAAAAGIGAAVTIGTYGFIGALSLLIPGAIAALLAFLTVVFLLIARQAIIIMLVILSPLAFVAYLLPNTEEWFTRWRKLFFAMLLLYPTLALLFGGGQLVAEIIRSTTDDGLLYVASLVIVAIPAFLALGVLRASSNILGKIAGFTNNPNRGPLDRARKGSQKYAERRQNLRTGRQTNKARDILSGERGGSRYGPPNSRKRRARAWVAGIGTANKVTREEKDKYAKIGADAAHRNYVAERASSDAEYAEKIGGDGPDMGRLVQSYALQAQHEEAEKDVKAAEVLLQARSREMSPNDYADHLVNLASDENAEVFERRAAIRQLHKVGNAVRVSRLTEAMADMGEASPGTETTAEVQREFGNTFRGDSRLPSSMSATMLSQTQNGQFRSHLVDRMLQDINGGIRLDNNGNEVERILDPQTGEVQLGKISKKYVSSMDVDEMKDWRQAIDADPTIVQRMTPQGKADLLQAMQMAADDPRLNIGYGPREYENMERIATSLGGTFTRPTK